MIISKWTARQEKNRNLLAHLSLRGAIKDMMREEDEEKRSRLDAEWAFLNATREMMNIARRKPDLTTYNQAIHFGSAIAPSILGEDKRLIHGLKESNEARLFREKALAETTIKGRYVTALEVAEAEIRELNSQVTAVPDAELLQGRLEILKKVRQELKPKRVTENQIIFRDAIKTNRHLPITGVGTDSVEYSVDENRTLRITVLHPDPPEHKIGADLIYEFHDLVEEKVRVAFLQYKMWDKKKLPYDPRMNRQLERLTGIGCKGQLCLNEGGDNEPSTYRFPYCCAFLRPTDRLQHQDATLQSSGLHIPLCVALHSWTNTELGAKVIKRSTIEKQAISHAIFEYLFVCSFVGSREIGTQELEKYYHDWGILDGEECIILHAQEFAK
jgi:hypothetical protein